jgi:hypothetical protein
MDTPVAGERVSANGRFWFLAAALLVFYGVSFGLPATGKFYIGDGMSLTNGLMGWEAFQKAWDPVPRNGIWPQTNYVWFANVWFWIGCLLLMFGFGRWAALMGAAGLLTGLALFIEHQQRGWNSQFLIGYWLWIASMAALLPAGIYQWRKKKGVPRDN